MGATRLFRVNGVEADLPLDPRVSLVDLLRETLQLPGTKKGCDQGACGACTVLVEGERILSCLALAVQYEGRDVITIEGLADEHGFSDAPSAEAEHLAHVAVDLVRGLMTTVLDAPRPEHDMIDATLTVQLVDYLRAHWPQQGLTPDRLASAHQISTRQLYRLHAARGTFLGHRPR